MKHVVLLVAIFLFTSCSSTYFFATLDTPNEYVEKVENGDFLLETDSLWIAYCFKGENAPIQITAFNKLDVPLYIDWHRSALIIDGMALTYAGDKFNYSEEWFEWGRDVSVATSDNTTFIPPNSMVSDIPFYLSPNFAQISNKEYRNSYLGNASNEAVTVKRIDYTQENAPLKFQSYLTIYAQSDKPMVFVQDFYLRNLIKTNSLKPKNLEHGLADRGDLFYVVKPANNSALYTTLAVIGVTGLTVIAVLYGDEDIEHYYDDGY